MWRSVVSHGHGEGALLRVATRERQPGDVEGVRERSEHLRPYDSEVSYTPEVDLGKDPVEDVSEDVAE